MKLIYLFYIGYHKHLVLSFAVEVVLCLLHHSDYLLYFQMKCVRYWPDPHQSREVGGRIVRNVGEIANPHYIVRQLEIQEDSTEPVSVIRLNVKVGVNRSFDTL